MGYLVRALELATRVEVAPSPALTGTTLTITGGDHAYLTVPCVAEVYPVGIDRAQIGAAEKIRITAVSGDTLTIQRQISLAPARAIAVGDTVYFTLSEPPLTALPSGTHAFQRAFVQLTSAQVLDLGTTAVELVPDPGENRAILIHQVTLRSRYGTAQYPPRNPFVGYGSRAAMALESTTFVLSLSNPFFELAEDGVAVTPMGITMGPLTQMTGPLILAAFGSMATGAVVTSRVHSGSAGADYAPGDTVTLPTEWDQDPPVLTVATVDGGGAILTYTMTLPGIGQAVASAIVPDATSGSGTGATFDILSIAPGDGSLDVTVYYTIEDLA